ncbi:hypothetical protein [Geodermatophilus sp. SYSU D01119]
MTQALTGVNVHPETLQRLIDAITTFQEQVESAKSEMTAAVGASAEGWNDSVSQRVTGEITELVEGLNVEAGDDIKATITAKLEQIEAFLAG